MFGLSVLSAISYSVVNMLSLRVKSEKNSSKDCLQASSGLKNQPGKLSQKKHKISLKSVWLLRRKIENLLTSLFKINGFQITR